ncbi:MAG: AMP-binding protein, partial [Oligoflexia bacterium]|nr:AMP-binding protein [Oligoflexia bacterium]
MRLVREIQNNLEKFSSKEAMVSFRDGKRQTHTFKELQERSYAYAEYFSKESKKGKIPIFYNASFESFAAILGGIFSQNIVVPLPANFQALETCLGKLQPKCSYIASSQENVKKIYEQRAVSFIEEKDVGKKSSFSLSIEDSLPIFLSFTSGSTGDPKGVLVREEAILFFVQYAMTTYGLNESDRIGQFIDPPSDMQIYNFFYSLLSGATLCVAPLGAHGFLAEFFKEEKISFTLSTPSHVKKSNVLKTNSSFWKKALFAGEGLGEQFVKTLEAQNPDLEIFNFYGLTEFPMISSMATKENRYKNGYCSIGKLVEGVKSAWEKSEEGLALKVSGEALFDSYVEPEREENLLVTLEEGQKWLHTGDLIYEDKDGFLFHQGRVGQFFKIDGERFSITELE